MIMRIKDWKIGQINRDMSKYNDKFYIPVEGSEFGHHYTEYADEDGYIPVRVEEVLKETEKAMQLSIDGFKTWVPKSAIA